MMMKKQYQYHNLYIIIILVLFNMIYTLKSLLLNNNRKKLSILSYKYNCNNNLIFKSRRYIIQCNDINTSITSPTTFDSKDDVEQIDATIKSLGNEIRELKLDKEKNKDIIGIKVKELTSLKNKYTELTTPTSSSVSPSSSPTSITSSNKKSNIDDDRSNQKTSSSSSQDSIITPRDQDYSMWYNDVIYASDMVDQSPVRGCMVIKPWGMGVWDILRGELDERIRDTGTSNAYFPLFIPQSFLSKEAEHVDGKLYSLFNDL